MERIKKRKSILLIVFIIVSFCFIIIKCYDFSKYEAEKSNIDLIDFSESGLNYYEVVDKKVCFYCVICFDNTGGKRKVVKVYAENPKDVDGGLLSQKELEFFVTDKKYVSPSEALDESKQLWPYYPYDISLPDVIELEENQKVKVNVVFVGNYGGTNIKSDRLMPPITNIQMIDE